MLCFVYIRKHKSFQEASLDPMTNKRFMVYELTADGSWVVLREFRTEGGAVMFMEKNPQLNLSLVIE